MVLNQQTDNDAESLIRGLGPRYIDRYETLAHKAELLGSDAIKALASIVEKADDVTVTRNALAVLSMLGEPGLAVLVKALCHAEPFVRQTAIAQIAPLGLPALDALTMGLQDDIVDVRRIAVSGLASIGEPAATPLAIACRDENYEIRESAAKALVEMGDRGFLLLTELLADSSSEVRQNAIKHFSAFGEQALKPLARMLDDPDTDVRVVAAETLGDLGEPALPALNRAMDDPQSEVREAAVSALRGLGEVAVPALTRALDDADVDIRYSAVYRLAGLGEAAYAALRHALDDESARVRRLVIDHTAVTGLEWAIRLQLVGTEDLDHDISGRATQNLGFIGGHNEFPIGQAAQIIIEEHILRLTGRSETLFTPDNTVRALQVLTSRDPRLVASIHASLCDVAFAHSGTIRHRAVDVARGLGAGGFAPLVKARAERDPKAAAEIMDWLGGEESTAFFTKQQSQTLEQYRAPLVELEKTSRQRWEELTKQARISFWISMGMSITLFAVGTGVIIWGLRLVTSSQELQQLIAGGLLTAAAGLATTYSGRFWKDPVEHIQRFSAQQARLQTAFIGYMNRIAQLRLVFEQDYADEGVPLDALEAYQRLLGDAIDQASRQLTVVEGSPKSEQAD